MLDGGEKTGKTEGPRGLSSLRDSQRAKVTRPAGRGERYTGRGLIPRGVVGQGSYCTDLDFITRGTGAVKGRKAEE